jgi:hypothetical protein
VSERKASDAADTCFENGPIRCDNAVSAVMLMNGNVTRRGWSGHAVRSNIQAGISSQRSASDPLSVQRQT